MFVALILHARPESCVKVKTNTHSCSHSELWLFHAFPVGLHHRLPFFLYWLLTDRFFFLFATYWASGHVSPVFKSSTLILNHTSPSPGTLMNLPITTPTYHPYLCYCFHDYQEAVCNEILNMAETSVRYCSSLSHYPHGSLHRLHPHPSKQSLIISQQPQSHSSSPEPSRLHCGM